MNNDHGLCLTLFAAQYLNMNFPIFFKQGKDKLLPKSDKKIDNLKLIENWESWRGFVFFFHCKCKLWSWKGRFYQK